jgi:hypothetical protein
LFISKGVFFVLKRNLPGIADSDKLLHPEQMEFGISPNMLALIFLDQMSRQET